MLDTTLYTDKLPASLNDVLKSFANGECVMVRKAKDKDKFIGKAGNCHVNVKNCIDKHGGNSISGWLLNRDQLRSERGMYVWSFHSVWQKPDGKLLDVTEDRHYVGRDKTIFVPDANRKPDLVKGSAYNNFIVFTDLAFANYYGNSVGKNLIPNKVYWSNNTMQHLLSEDEHSGEYLLIINYPDNYKNMCDEYQVDYIDGKFVKRDSSDVSGGLPIKILFDYNLKNR